MKKALLSLFLLFAIVPILAQNTNVSKLQKQLSVASSDNNKIDISIDLINAYASINLDSSILYFEDAIQLAKKNNAPLKIINTQKSIIDILMSKGIYTKAKNFIDEGLVIGRQLENDSIICNHLMFLVTWHWEMSNTKQSFEAMNEALFYANKAKSPKYKAMIFSSYGIFYGGQGDEKKEREYFQKSLQIFKDINDISNQVIILQNLADSYFHKKDFSTALKLTNQALELIKASNTKGLIYKHVLAFKGNILYNLGETDLGFSFLDSALVMATADNNSRLIVLISNEKAKWLLHDQKYDEAINAAKIGVEICKKNWIFTSITRAM